MDDGSPIGGLLAGVILSSAFWLNADSLFPEAYDELITLEGGYVHNPHDYGGETMWGITEAVARKCGWRGAMRDLPIETAAECSYKHYWKPLSADKMASRRDSAYKEFVLDLFHTGYHAGPGSATRWFQTCLNELNRGGRDYKDVRIDGKIGRETLRAFKMYRAWRGDAGAKVLSTCLKVGYGARLRSALRNNERQEEFAYGWYRRLGE